jgi:membrane protein
MAFYHFLALFPALLVLLAGLDRVPGLAPHMKHALVDVGQQFLPEQAATLLQQMIAELGGKVPAGWPLVSAVLGALWAALNATWALMYGLNIAYEVSEGRPWWRLGLTVTGLMLLLTFSGLVGFLSLFSAAHMAHRVFGPPQASLTAAVVLRSVQWLIVITLLMISASAIYRFGPDLRQAGWKRSAPGAICALTLWVAITVGVRLYFQHINDYTLTYGHLNSVVMLLLWLYLTNGAILIGGEMNSEIEKAAGERQHGEENTS